MTTGSTGSPFPKWQLAILLGAPVAIGLGYLYYRNSSIKATDTVVDNKKDNKKLLGNLKEQTISLDDDDKSMAKALDNRQPQQKTRKNLSPLEQAIECKFEGNASFKKGKYDEAIVYYDKAIELCPKDNPIDLSTFYQNRAAAYEQLKKWSAVKLDCTNALELNSRYVKALQRRARANEYINDLTASLEDVTATCLLEGFQNNNSLVFADRVLKQMGREDARKAMKDKIPTLPSSHFIKTYMASFTQDPIQKITVPVNASGKDDDLKGFLRARQLMDHQKYDDIIPLCTEEIESSESEAEYKNEATLLRGTFYLLRGSKSEAMIDFDSLIQNSDASIALRVNALIKKASANVQNENVEQSFQNFAEAESLDATNADVYHQRGQVYVLLENLDNALKDFTEAVRLAPDHGATLAQKTFAEYRCAVVQQDEMALLRVMNGFKNAIEKFPDCVECYSIMAQVLTEQGQFEQADSFFDKAAKLAPTNASMYVHRAIMQLQWNGDINKSLDYMNQAISIDDKCELAYETLGTIEVQRGNLERAVELFEIALSLAKAETEMVHLFSLRNAAAAQISVAKKMGIDMSTLSALTTANI